MQLIEQLQDIRRFGGRRKTVGLSDAQVREHAQRDSALELAVHEAYALHQQLRSTHGDILALDEVDQIQRVQAKFVNFYPEDGVNPYVSLAARGPWIVTTLGAVIYDAGGYGMLGLGHAPEAVLEAMNRPHVMANIMTPNLSQLRLSDALSAEIGHRRTDGSPFARYLALNSGSEAVTVAARISDVNAKTRTDPGGPQAGQPIRRLSLRGGFHGRTDRPAHYSDSTRATYMRHLASFRDADDLLIVEPNDVDALHRTFDDAEAEGVFIESMFVEPVMGEGNPGLAVDRAFYDAARERTKRHGSLLLVDSIQAGLRAHGSLSVVDYPGFEDCEAPDMETYSKALNNGQYPLSVLAMTQPAADLYRKGIYGNTMTANPRAMDVGAAVLGAITPQMRANIQQRGVEVLDKLNALSRELDGAITRIQGTGLLFSCELSHDYKCFGANSTEEYLRTQGLGVIHGGERSLRFTPYFNMSSAEVDLIIDKVRDALINGPRASQPSATRQAG